MGALLALLAAVAYGASDFGAGLASRRFAAGPVTAVAQVFGLATAVAAVILLHSGAPDRSTLLWGAVSGLGSGLGTLTLYRGLALGPMSLVATIAAVLTAVLPAAAGILLGNHLSWLALAGIVLAVPSIGLVSWQSATGEARSSRIGIIFGVLAGVGFALLFIALAQAGTEAGAWPLVPGQAVSLVCVAPFALSDRRPPGKPWAGTFAIMVGAALLSGVANLLFLASTGHGQLAVVAVLSAMYPAVTVLLARVVLNERWTRLQIAGLSLGAVAVLLVTLG